MFKLIKKIINLPKYVGQSKLTIQFNQKRYLLEQNILYSKEPGVTECKYCNHNIVVSLTTYGKRIYDVALTIESIMEQTMRANKIVLWLDNSFANREFPQSIKMLEKRGLEIKFCEDLRSYKKLIPSLTFFPNDVIVTIDDDVIYDYDMLERLICPYLKNPQYIHCLRHHRIKFDNKGILLPYVKWDFMSKDNDLSPLNFFIGVGGVLYPPNSLHKDVFDKSTFMDICQYGDDIWFNVMALRKGTRVSQGYTRTKDCIEGIENYSVQDVGLSIDNLSLNRNDVQIKNVFEKYDIYTLLK